ncbi:hypothetical protein [Roseobacter weihaiensis]|uniref:hypothetical protein n=1 Tax=Roseobacter weihaiensis TaxID=2763262 RepID=UPI001D0B82C5|nr:hypothetical protein [Roseobacter sp. H9]
MSWSATEIMTLAGKAARGAGAPPAQAARFGQVVVVHLTAARDVAVLSAALEALPEGPILAYPLVLDQALSDAGQGLPAALPGLEQDALLVSFVEALPFQASLQATGTDGLRLRVDLATPRPHGVPRRITGCDGLIAQMTELADRTYVPDSDSSRRVGAGARLTDND